jgi:Na+/H+ antiporter NhaD/arsenite permease-like protein
MEMLKHYLPGIFALVVAATGWFYLFYSTAAQGLTAAEPQPANRRRVRLRRVGGVVMLLLGFSFYAGFYAVQWDPPGRDFALVWLAVTVLLMILVVLALVDLRLTMKLRRRQHRDRLS